MPVITPSGQILGATVSGVDLRQDLSRQDFGTVLRALGEHGVLCFPGQALEAADLRRFSTRFGDLQVLKNIPHHEPGMPEVTILSNVKVGGKLIGAPDAGQSWHTDMSYAKTIGFVNILSAFQVPVRDGRVLGGTEFTNTQAAAADLPPDMIARLSGLTATHDIEYYWEYMRREKGSNRPPLTEEQKRQRPPVHHPVLLTHPITGRKVIYVNPGFTTGIDGLPEPESAQLLQYLLDHVLRDKYRYVHDWTVGDLLLWDHIGTWHFARPDYGPDEHRLMKRCQVMATRIFDPAFVRDALPAHVAAAG
jgi:taurine dioxygenase